MITARSTERGTGRGASATRPDVVPESALSRFLAISFAILLGATSAAPAQEGAREGAPHLRAVQVLEPASGAASRTLLRPLTPSERLRIETALAEADLRPGDVDGVFDEGTARALEAFQDEYDLVRCGCASLETVEALGIEVRVVMTEVASSEEEVRRIARGRDAGAAARTGAGVEIVYPTTPAPASEPSGPESDRAAEQEGAVRETTRAPAQRPGAPPIFHRSGMFVGSTFAVPVLVVDSAGKIVPFRPGVPVVSPGETPRADPGMNPFSRHRVPLPPIRGGGRPPAGGGSTGGGGAGGR